MLHIYFLLIGDGADARDKRSSHGLQHPIRPTQPPSPRRGAPSCDTPTAPRIVQEACGTVWNTLRAQKITGAGRHVAVYLDGEINLEVGVELDTPFAASGEVIASATPVGPVATTTHYGSYGRLNEAHEAIRLWCSQNGHTPAGPNWEIYGHWKDEWNSDPTKITTDVYHLLQSRAEGD